MILELNVLVNPHELFSAGLIDDDDDDGTILPFAIAMQNVGSIPSVALSKRTSHRHLPSLSSNGQYSKLRYT